MKKRPPGKWGKADVPKKGWTCIDVEDLDEPCAICEMCEKQEIRYVHHMEHPNYPKPLSVGCVCAGRMEGDYKDAKRRESRKRRLANWLKRAWLKSRRGNRYLNTGAYNVVIFQRWNGPVAV